MGKQRPWKPLSAKRIKAILANSEQGCLDDVYSLACEVLALRKRVTEAAQRLDDEANSLAKAGLSAGAAFAESVWDVLRGKR